MKARHILIASMAFFLASCNDGSITIVPLEIELQGVVSDSGNGSPIGGASVVLGKIKGFSMSETLATTSTDPKGFYSLRYSFSDQRDCNPLLMYLQVGLNLAWEKKYRIRDILFSFDKPHVDCIRGLQTINVQLEPWY